MGTVVIEDLRAEYTLPSGRGPFPGLVVLHEIFGPNEDMARITARLTEAGYACVAPDLYSASLRPLCIAQAITDMVRGRESATLRRLGQVRDWLAEQPGIDGARLGVIGFCMGGTFALMTAAHHEYGAAAAAYAQAPKEAELARLCPVVASYGGRDKRLLPHRDRLVAALEREGIPHDVETYPEAGHSFMNRSLPKVLASVLAAGYSHDEAEDSWGRILAFLGAALAPR